MRIEPVAKDDLIIISHLANKIWPISYADMITQDQIDYMLDLMYSHDALIEQVDSGHKFFILLKDDTPIGYIGLEIFTDVIFIHKLYILPEEQGKAYGNLLINYAEQLGLKNNCFKLRLNVNRNNKAISFYKRSNFEITKSLDTDIGCGYFMNDYQMEKKILV